MSKPDARIAIVGGGPSALLMAAALAKRNLETVVFERDPHPDETPRYNPDRSYTIDTSGHGLRALRYIDATSYFDERVNRFKGIKVLGTMTEEWKEPGWTGSRGDILRALMALIKDRHADKVHFEHKKNVVAVDSQAGTVMVEGSPASRSFDLVIGADGAGSAARRALEEQITGFTTQTKSFPMYATMIALDRPSDQLDPFYLHMFTVAPFVVAGAIRGDEGPGSTRWFCAVCTNRELSFGSPAEAEKYFRENSPRVLEYAGPESLASFASRKSQHIGRSLRCSQLYGGKVVLLGDAAAPFPPIGQGLNAALESAMVLDQCVGQDGSTAEGLLAAARRYDGLWRPETEAVAWIAERHLAENRFHNFRTFLTHALFGLSVVGETKRSDISYSEARRKAQRLWPLWS